MAGIFSPDVRNYNVGRGFALFSQQNQDTGVFSPFVHLGNCPKITYTTEVTTLPHFSVMAGVKVQDFSVILQEGGKIAITMEERTLENLLLFFLGSQIKHTSGNIPELSIYGQTQQIQGEFKFIATNNVGPRWYFDLTRVLLAPTGDMGFIDETGWNNFTVQATHVIDDNGSFGTMSLQPPVSSIPPQNVMLPFMVGSLGETTLQFAPVHGETISCNTGAWIAMQTTAFQWYASGTLISGATFKNYIPTVGQVGQTLSCTVTGTNPNGQTSASTVASLPIV